MINYLTNLLISLRYDLSQTINDINTLFTQYNQRITTLEEKMAELEGKPKVTGFRGEK